MKIYCIAGEASGDLHQSNLLKALRKHLSQAHFRGIGGDKSEKQGLELYRPSHKVAFMGFQEVFLNLRTIQKVMKETKKDILAYQPDLLILTDFSGFNLRMAKYAQQNHIPVYYYIAPKVWAWNTKRVKKIQQYVDRVFSILPFEADFFKAHDIEVDYVGNPLMDALADFEPNPAFREQHGIEKPIIALLPGSRSQEVKSHMKLMAKVKRHFPDHDIVAGAVPFLPAELYDSICQETGIIKVTDETYDLLSHAQAAVVCSGTATLETALLNVPQVVGYRTSFVSALFAKMVLQVPYISLVNLILDKQAVKELLQYAFTEQNMVRELKSVLPDGASHARMMKDYKQLQDMIGQESASTRAAETMLKRMKEDKILD